MLSAAAIVAEAEARVGSPDTESALYGPNLAALVDSLNAEAGLSPDGRATAHEALVNRTAHRIETLKWIAEHPEIAEEEITAPVFLTGLPRSGTTFFQYLFDRDSRFRLLRSWEAIQPYPPPGFAPDTVPARIAAEVERLGRNYARIEGLAALHLADADGPEECHGFLEQAYAAAGFHNVYDVPAYFEHLTTALGFTAAYRAHKRQLQLLQWRTPRPRWALKYPNHVLAMDAILAVYPDARFVMTHRDPVQTLASISKLTLKVRESRAAGAVDPRRVGRQMLHFVRRHIDRILAFDTTPGGRRVVHVDYYRLIDNPAAVMSEVHAGLEIATPDEVRAAVAEWHLANPKGARGANPYALETFGLDADAAADHFADYMRRFDVPREQAGLARTAA